MKKIFDLLLRLFGARRIETVQEKGVERPQQLLYLSPVQQALLNETVQYRGESARTCVLELLSSLDITQVDPTLVLLRRVPGVHLYQTIAQLKDLRKVHGRYSEMFMPCPGIFIGVASLHEPLRSLICTSYVGIG